jgi:hypothetical protein
MPLWLVRSRPSSPPRRHGWPLELARVGFRRRDSKKMDRSSTRSRPEARRAPPRRWVAYFGFRAKRGRSLEFLNRVYPASVLLWPRLPDLCFGRLADSTHAQAVRSGLLPGPHSRTFANLPSLKGVCDRVVNCLDEPSSALHRFRNA